MSSYQSFSIWLLQVSVVSGLLVFFLWLILRPSNPEYAIVDLTVPIHHTTDNNDSIISFGLEASNENKGGRVYYNDINVTVYFGTDSIIGTRVLPSFSQGHEKTTEVNGNVAVIDERAMKDVVSAVTDGKKTVRLKLGLSVTVRYRMWTWRSKVHSMVMEGWVKVGKDGNMGRKKKIKMYRCRRKKARKLLSI